MFRLPVTGRLQHAHADYASGAFEAHPDAQFVVDACGEIRGANAAGRRLFAGPAGAFALSKPLPTHVLSQVSDLLDRVDEVLRTQRPSSEFEVALTPSLEFAICVCPLGPGFGAVLLIVRPRESRAAISARERFGFTQAETLVAERLARGLTVPQIALQLGISIETVRCHLKQAFSKARVHRQAELVSVMLGG